MKMLKITACNQCRYFKQITSPYTGDSFDMSDVDSICIHPETKGREECKGAHERVIGRCISVADRPWQTSKATSTIPSWCPL